MREFKVGDLVYCTMHGNRIYTIHDKYDSMSEDCPLWVNDNSFMIDGRFHANRPMPDLLHATPENHELLEKLYGVEFEKPPVKPTSKEIIQAMLERGDKCVPCWVSDCKENPGADSVLECIVGYSDDFYPFKLSKGGSWKYATPFDPRTGKPITELPE